VETRRVVRAKGLSLGIRTGVPKKGQKVAVRKESRAKLGRNGNLKYGKDFGTVTPVGWGLLAV